MTKRRIKTYTKTDFVQIFGFADFRTLKRVWEEKGLSKHTPLKPGKQVFTQSDFDRAARVIGIPKRPSW